MSIHLNLEPTDWTSQVDQQIWFDRFKSTDAPHEGLKFLQFQEFLKVTIYHKFSNLIGIIDGDYDEICKFTYQQELQLFKSFDQKNDHIIDRDEFGVMCQNWIEKTLHPAYALVVVDVQNDFIDGSLALINGPAGEDGIEVVPVINQLLDNFPFDAVVYTQDWHPIDHIGFFDNLHLRKYTFKKDVTSKTTANNGNEVVTDGDDYDEEVAFKLKKLTTRAKLFDTVLFDEGRMEQILWPVHCVQNSWGAELHPKLKVIANGIRVYKGTLSHVDAYSAFWDNMRLNETNLRQELTTRKITEVFFCGLALDYCVAASAIDSAKAGLITIVIEDACRGIDKEMMAKRKDEMAVNGVLFTNSLCLSDGMLPIALAKSICLKRVLGQ